MKYFVTALCFLMLLTGCIESDVVLKSSPHIKTFKFGSHNAAPGIENIVFTVDSINCVVYNEDSIAYNSNITKLFPTITYTGTPKEVKMNGVSWADTDSLDFTNPVSMYILSQNKQNEATYTITVNKHRVNPDEIIWKDPITIANQVNSFQVASTQQGVYVFANTHLNDTYQYNLYCNTGNGWVSVSNFQSAHNITSLGTYQNEIYAIDQVGTVLLKFEQDQWITVSSLTEGKMTTLLGEQDNALWIAASNNDHSVLMAYNGQVLQENTQATLPALFALEDATPLQTPYGLYLIGGKKDGVAQNCILSSDNGYYWTNILNQSGAYAITPCYNAICAYYHHQIYVIGGLNNDAVVTDNYTSNNNGYSWQLMPSYQQIPQPFEYQKGASAAVFNNNLYVFSYNKTQQQTLEVWEGRIRKVDFIRQ